MFKQWTWIIFKNSEAELRLIDISSNLIDFIDIVVIEENFVSIKSNPLE